MKISHNIIKKIFSGKLKLKNKMDKIELSQYTEYIPMYDIYSDNIYPIQNINLHYRLITCHYRFITEEIKQRVLANCKAGKYTQFGSYKIEKTEDLDGFKFILGNGEWVMVRASGTEPVLRVYSESSTNEKATAILEATKAVLLA